MSSGKVSIPLVPSEVSRSPMSPISQTPGIAGAPPRIPFPMVFFMGPNGPYGILYGNSLTPIGWTNMEMDGMIPIGSSTGVPVAANITAGTGISILNGPNSITISTTASSFHWNVIGAGQPLSTNNGYICAAGGALILALPAVSAVGDRLEIILDGSGSFKITQAANQQIKLAMIQTLTGVGGSITSTSQGDSLALICTIANLRWLAISSTGNPIIV